MVPQMPKKKRRNVQLYVIILSLFLISLSSNISQTLPNNFEHFRDKDGLPSNDTGPLLQDHLGYIWIGTTNGLSRYDGYEFQNFSVVPNDSNFLQLPLICSLFEDSNGDLWIGAIGGLTKYNRDKESFTLYSLAEFDQKEERTLLVRDICETTNGNILFTVMDMYIRNIKNGLYKIDNKTKEMEVVNFNNEDSTDAMFQISRIGNANYLISGVKGIAKYDHIAKSLNWYPIENETRVLSFLMDKNNIVWLGTANKGIIKYNATDYTFTKYPLIQFLDIEDDWSLIFNIIFDQNNNLVFTSNKGLIHFDRESKKYSKTKIDPLNPSALHSDDLNDIMLDKTGSVWITSSDAGISKYNLSKNNFRSFVHTPNDPKSLSPGWTGAIFENKENEIWLPNQNNGITKIDLKIDKITHVDFPYGVYANTIYRDSKDQIWLGGYSGLFKAELENWEFEKIDIPINLNQNTIHVLFEDSEGTFWIGAHDGLYTFDRVNTSVAKTDFQSLGIGSSFSNAIFRLIEDKNKNIWIGTEDGLFKFNIKNKQYTRVGFSSDPLKFLSSQNINSLYEDVFGTIWIGTWLGGLNSYDPQSGNIISYIQKDGLNSHSVQGILGDEENGALWVSTYDGIARFDLEIKVFNNFNMEDGLHDNQFADGSKLKTADGNFIFGGRNGFTIFKPEEIKGNLVTPKILITDFKIFNRTVKPGDNSPLKVPIYKTKRISLSHDENDISFYYSAVHYVNPKKNQFAYRLINYDDEWRYVGNQRSAIYPNLPSGEYEFQVKAANNNNVWNEEPKALSIIISTPPWATWWAYTMYVLSVFGFLYSVRKFEMGRQQKNAEIKESHLRVESAELQAKAAEAQAQVMQVENERKSKELEEARQLQLSMLPKELPQLPNLDIAVYMKTATEVGGDYYDFNIGLDGTLTVVLGDATGHGMKAGTMVTTTKSLFNVLAPNPNIIETFHEMTRCLKLMHLEKLSMCMTMLKIEGNNLRMSAAGMPPVFIYKGENQTIEEHVMKGMPLGTLSDFPYTLIESELLPGDTILLMSDGFPELFNNKKKMYGYKRARNYFEEIARESPEEIIHNLKTASLEWVNDKDPDDDVTFVVIKVK
jgi:serine phosphatase RsbU (regulator of sigma subunit)/ligand-binding sensor domain-containing protein